MGKFRKKSSSSPPFLVSSGFNSSFPPIFARHPQSPWEVSAKIRGRWGPERTPTNRILLYSRIFAWVSRILPVFTMAKSYSRQRTGCWIPPLPMPERLKGELKTASSKGNQPPQQGRRAQTFVQPQPSQRAPRGAEGGATNQPTSYLEGREKWRQGHTRPPLLIR